jgi:predicted lysophospholipase L1 biosynthesis ABC-type transport system permease subunit
MPVKNHFGDMSWYIAIGLLAVVAIAVLVIYVPERDWPSSQWAWFSLFTIMLFAFLSKFYWNIRKPKKFWAVLFAIFAAHIVLFAPVLHYIQRAFWYLSVGP